MKPVSIETELPAIAERAVLKQSLAGEVPEKRAHACVLSLPAQAISDQRLLQQELIVVTLPNIKTTGEILTNIVRSEDSAPGRMT